MEEKYPHPKMNTKQWVENFWYYNKWFFLLGVVVLLFVLISTIQYFSKKPADVSILCVGSDQIHESICKKIIHSAEGIVSDNNGDGKVAVELETIRLYSDLSILNQVEQNQAEEDYREYSNEILGGDACILLLDEYFFQELANNGTLVNLYKVFEELPKGSLDPFGVRLGDCPLYRLDGFSQLSPDLILCLKYSAVLSDISDEERAVIDVENQSIFRAFYEGKSN